MDNSYQELLSRVSEIIGGSHLNDFNIFDMLGQKTRELTHSAFIAQLSTFVELYSVDFS